MNNGVNSLHGGEKGFDKILWVEEEDRVQDPSAAASVLFSHRSPAGDQGYPGELDVYVRYSWSDANELGITLTARLVEEEDRAKGQAPPSTIVNLTNHTCAFHFITLALPCLALPCLALPCQVDPCYDGPFCSALPFACA